MSADIIADAARTLRASYAAYLGMRVVILQTMQNKTSNRAFAVLNQAIKSDWFELILFYGVERNVWTAPNNKKSALARTFESDFRKINPLQAFAI